MEADTLKPESVASQQSDLSIPTLPTTVPSLPINEKTDELLLNIDEDEATEHDNRATRILDELTDLKFELNSRDKNELD